MGSSTGDLTAYDLLLTAVLMIRKTLTIISLIGLLLSAVAWAGSYYGFSYNRVHFPSHTSFTFMNGFLQVLSLERWSNRGPEFRSFLSKHVTWSHGAPIREIAEKQSLSLLRAWRPYWKSGTFTSGKNFSVAVIPLWNLACLFLLLFGVSNLPLHRRRKRKKLGLCLKCGYDLRASKDRCPECGTEFESSGAEELGSSTGDADG